MVTEGDPQMEEMDSCVQMGKAILAGRDPAVQSAVLAELVALYLCGHPDFVREIFFDQYCMLVRNLVLPVERELFRGGHHPQNQGLPLGGMRLGGSPV